MYIDIWTPLSNIIEFLATTTKIFILYMALSSIYSFYLEVKKTLRKSKKNKK